jgi:hypothetical protein
MEVEYGLREKWKKGQPFILQYLKNNNMMVNRINWLAKDNLVITGIMFRILKVTKLERGQYDNAK